MASFRVPRGGTVRIDIRIAQREEQAAPTDAPRQPLFPSWPSDDYPASIMSKVALIITYTANHTSIQTGQTVTFSFTCTPHTTALKLRNVSTGAETSLTVPSGSITVTPAGPTSGTSVVRAYRLIADGPYGHHEERVINITVTTCQVINSFTATPAAIGQGASTTLAWATSGGSSIAITDLSTGITTSVAASGSLVVTPASSRSYRLTVNGACAAVTRDVAVTVTPCQTITSYSAAPTTITSGQSTTLSWATAHASAVTITDLNTGTVTSVAASGSQAFSPAASTTYRLTVTGACSTLTQDIAITVNP